MNSCARLNSVSYRKGPAQQLLGEIARIGDPTYTAASSDLRLGVRAKDSQSALEHYLSAAKKVYPKVSRGTANDDEQNIYNAACAESAAIVFQMHRDGNAFNKISIEQKSYSLAIDDHTKGANFLNQEEVSSSARIKVKKLEDEVIQSGVGGALAVYRSRESFTDPHIAENISNEGAVQALTSIVEFRRSGEIKLHLYEPGKEDDIILAGRSRKLAADFSTPLGVLGSKSARGGFGFRALVASKHHEKYQGLFFTEPLRSDKIPLVFVHGLKSAPRVWVKTYLALMEDERIREKYQIWFYRYPTGYGLAKNAANFRESFARAMKAGGNGNRAFRQTVLVGHSMGGLMSSAIIRSSGDRIWKKLVKDDSSLAGMSEEDRRDFESRMRFQAQPEIRRAVFMATPHRGSAIADGAAGALGRALIQLPGDLLSLQTPALLSGLSELGAGVLTGGNTSIDLLESNSWQLKLLEDLPMSPRITYHSIVGNKSGEGELKDSTDGVVPYWSSHLDGAASEKVVVSDHSVPQNDNANIELKRILHLHLKKSGR